VQDANGNFYGTTLAGGANDYGAVFKITPTGELRTLYSFCSGGYPCNDGNWPFTALVQRQLLRNYLRRGKLLPEF